MSKRLIAIITMLLCAHHHVNVVAGMCANNVCVTEQDKRTETEGGGKGLEKMCSMPLGAWAEDIRIHYELRCLARNP